MALKNLKIQMPDTGKAIAVNVEQTTLIKNLVDTLKEEGTLDKNKHYIIKTVNGSFIPPGVDVQEHRDDEFVIIESKVAIPDFGGETANNTQQRCQLLLLLDTSYSMLGSPIDELNKGLQVLAQGIKSDPIARQRVEISIITFNTNVAVIQQPALIDEFDMPLLTVDGTTKLVDAARTAINIMESRKKWHKDNNLGFYRPHIVMITDGMPDSDQDIIGLGQEIKNGGKKKQFAFLPVGVTGADETMLKQIAQDEFPPLPLNGLEFDTFFDWLSNSIAAVSKSRPGEKVNYANPLWISKTGWGGN